MKDVKDVKEKAMNPDELSKRALQKAKEKQKADEEEARIQSQTLGSLAPNSLFADPAKDPKKTPTSIIRTDQDRVPQQPDYPDDEESAFSARNPSNMAVTLNPRPNARARWQRRMVIRDIRHRGRLSKAMQIARSERSHLSRSHFFKTSMKKLAPLARQIAGKSIDEAITQMRFSNKKAAIDVRQHLITARDEAIVARGMGLPTLGASATASTAAEDPSITPPLPTQRANRGLKQVVKMSDGTTAKVVQNQTDIYIAEAWTNRGPYGQEADYRAKGRINMMRPPYTGLSVLLKEEKTRTREKGEKEAKAIRKRIGKNMWTQLPDRPIVRQSQQVLW
jgi:ribosomal protein L22